MDPIIIGSEIDKEISSLKIEFKKTFIILEQYYSATETDQLEKIFEIWYEVYKKRVRVYSSLSEHFFNLNPLAINQADENTNIFLWNINLFKEIAEKREVEDGFREFIDKIQDHIELIGIQVNRMDSGVNEINETKSQLSNEIKVLKKEIITKKEEFNKLSDNISELTKKQNVAVKKAKKVQKDFVAILGIFASILIGTFGGITALSSVFTNIKEASTGKLLLFGSFIVLAIILIVFLLLNGISKLTEVNLRSCGCEKECNCSITKKHPTLFIITTLLLTTAVAGASTYIIDYRKLLKNVSQGTLVFGVLFIILLIYVSTYAYYLKFNNKSKLSN